MVQIIYLLKLISYYPISYAHYILLRLEQRHRHEQELRGRIEHLEKRQQSDEGVLTTVNRYWNQLNEDLRILLQRFDAETADEIEKENEDAATTSFMATLAQWDKEELEERLGQRVLVSTRAVSKLLQAFDRLMQRNHKVWLANDCYLFIHVN